MTLQELRDSRKRLADQAEEILKSARDENRELLGDEEAKFDAFHVDIAKLKTRIDREERQADVLASLTAGEGRRSDPAPPTQRALESSRQTAALSPEALRAWCIAGTDEQPTPAMRDAAARCGISLEQKRLTLRLPQTSLRSLVPDEIREWEKRAQGVATGSAGGFTVPDETMRALEVSLLEFGGMRQTSTIVRTDSGAALPVPTVDDTSQKGVILAENTTATEQGVTFGQIVFDAYKYSSKYILVSAELLQDASFNVPAYIGGALGNRIGRITNDHFTTGTGSSQPNGVVTASSQGKQGATGQTASVIYDDLVDLLHSVDIAYRTGARWMFHDATLKALKKIKVPQFSGDTNGQPLWQPGMALGVPDTILGYPYTVNNSMATMAASAKSILFGQLSKYWIRDVRDVTLLRLDERFAELHQVAFLAFSRHDGDLIDSGTDPVKHYANSAS